MSILNFIKTMFNGVIAIAVALPFLLLIWMPLELIYKAGKDSETAFEHGYLDTKYWFGKILKFIWREEGE